MVLVSVTTNAKNFLKLAQEQMESKKKDPDKEKDAGDINVSLHIAVMPRGRHLNCGQKAIYLIISDRLNS